METGLLQDPPIFDVHGMDDTCDLGFRQFLNGPLPEPLARWLAERKTKRQYLTHAFKPKGANSTMQHPCFHGVDDIPMYMLGLCNSRGRLLSYVGYNLYPNRGKRVLMLEYLCTDEKLTEPHLNRHLVALLVGWALEDRSIRGIIADSINGASGRMLSRYFGMAKVMPEEVLDAEASASPLPSTVQDILGWSYCCRDHETPDWRHLWKVHRRLEVSWSDPTQDLPSYNTHLNLEAPGVRRWVGQLLRSPPRPARA